MESLGTLLLQSGRITKQQLGLAISKQREIGGRLGTCLLEMGAISEDLLDRVLAEQQGVQIATAEDLREISEELIQLLPARIAIRYRAVPFSVAGARVEIAMLEVDNLWLQDELSFIIGRRLKVYIASEVRLVSALARYYGAPLSERFNKLERMLEQQRQPPAEKAPETHPESRLVYLDEVDKPSSQVVPIRGTAQDSGASVVDVDETRQAEEESSPHSIPLSDSELDDLGAGAASEWAGGSVSPFVYSRDHSSDGAVEIEDVEARLAAAGRPEEVGQILVDYLAQFFVRVLIFQVRQGAVFGWLGHGPGLDRERLADFKVHFKEPSIFLNLREGGSFFIGKLPDMPPHLELASCWKKDLADECAVFPIRIQEHLVSLIYGDRGPLGLQALDLELIRRLTTIGSQAFERCILQQKQARLRQASDR
jgi:hypothetical protein